MGMWTVSERSLATRLRRIKSRSSSSDLVSPDLVNVSDLSAAWDRYSSISNGNAQALDHVITTANLASQFAGVVRPRVNADFPAALSGDPSTPADCPIAIRWSRISRSLRT